MSPTYTYHSTFVCIYTNIMMGKYIIYYLEPEGLYRQSKGKKTTLGSKFSSVLSLVKNSVPTLPGRKFGTITPATSKTTFYEYV